MLAQKSIFHIFLLNGGDCSDFSSIYEGGCILSFVFHCRDENASILDQNTWVPGIFVVSKYCKTLSMRQCGLQVINEK